MEKRVNRRRILTAKVVSDKMDKTRVVTVARVAKHTKYLKPVRSVVKFKAHDENNTSKVGDTVHIMETRPISKDKRWVIRDVVESKA